MTYTKHIPSRVRQVKLMNKNLFDTQENIIYTWLTLGCPDGADNEEIRDCVEDEETYVEWLDLYNRLMRYWKEEC